MSSTNHLYASTRGVQGLDDGPVSVGISPMDSAITIFDLGRVVVRSALALRKALIMAVVLILGFLVALFAYATYAWRNYAILEGEARQKAEVMLSLEREAHLATRKQMEAAMRPLTTGIKTAEEILAVGKKRFTVRKSWSEIEQELEAKHNAKARKHEALVKEIDKLKAGMSPERS